MEMERRVRKPRVFRPPNMPDEQYANTMKFVEGYVANGYCGTSIGEHMCSRTDCGMDDPEWVHYCYAGDCDFTEEEFVKLRLGKISEYDVRLVGLERAQKRNYDESAASALAEARAQANAELEKIRKSNLPDPWGEVQATGWDKTPLLEAGKIRIENLKPTINVVNERMNDGMLRAREVVERFGYGKMGPPR